MNFNAMLNVVLARPTADYWIALFFSSFYSVLNSNWSTISNCYQFKIRDFEWAIKFNWRIVETLNGFFFFLSILFVSYKSFEFGIRIVKWPKKERQITDRLFIRLLQFGVVSFDRWAPKVPKSLDRHQTINNNLNGMGRNLRSTLTWIVYFTSRNLRVFDSLSHTIATHSRSGHFIS